MVDKSGMIRLRRKRQKAIEESALKEVCKYFDDLIDFIVEKIVDDNYALMSGDDKSIEIFSETFILEPLSFVKGDIKYENIIGNNNIFYFLKKDDNFRKYVNLARVNDKDFGNINVDKLVFILSTYDKLTDFVSVGTRHVEIISTESVRHMVEKI